LPCWAAASSSGGSGLFSPSPANQAEIGPPARNHS
jgi:hypothetical protein